MEPTGSFAEFTLSEVEGLRMTPLKIGVFRGALKKITVPILFAAFFIAIFPAHASEQTYRIISEIKDGATMNREKKITRRVLNSARQINWKNLAHDAWLPNACEAGEEYLVVSDNVMPQVSVLIRIMEAEQIEIYGFEFLRCNFSFLGKWEHGDFGPMGESGQDAPEIRSLTIEGDGYIAIDATDKRPAAGRLHLLRKALPALWLENATEGALTSEMEIAWTRVP